MQHFQTSSPLLQTQLPFAVIGSTEDITVGNKTVKGRMYPWGSVQGNSTLHNCLTNFRNGCKMPSRFVGEVRKVILKFT